MKKMTLLTPRDAGLLYDCYQQTALSFEQVGRRHFRNAQAPTICNRLTKLIRAGFMTKQSVGLILYLGQMKRVDTIYQVTRQGIRILEMLYPMEKFREESVRIHPATLAHDLLLTDVSQALQMRFPDRKWVNGRVRLGVVKSAERLPDALVLTPSGEIETAVELELTAKSDKRYREIILQYRLSQQYKSVLYVTATQSIADKIKFQISGRAIPGLSAPHPTGKFSFLLLDEIRTQKGLIYES
jgi:hypothetical protein